MVQVWLEVRRAAVASVLVYAAVLSVPTRYGAGASARRAVSFLASVAACAATPPAQATSWQEYEVKDRSGTVIGQGVEFNGKLSSDYGARVVDLSVECVNGKAIVRIEVRNFDFGVWPVALRWRVDDHSEHSATWPTCDNGGCTGLWNDQASGFLKSLIEANELSLTLTQRHSKPMKARFLLKGSAAAIRNAGRPCGWR